MNAITPRLGRTDEAVLFDFNGVLVDDEPLHYQSFQQVLGPHGLAMWPSEYRRYLGFDDRGTFAAFVRDHGVPLDAATLEAWVAEKQTLYARAIAASNAGAHLFPGARALVLALAHGGVPLAIVSGARRVEIDDTLGAAGLTACFPVVVAAEDVAAPKPAPEGYRLAFDRLRHRHPHLRTGIAIEDAPAGIAAARAAGLGCIGVTTSCTPAELDGARWIVNSLKEIALVEEVAA